MRRSMMRSRNCCNPVTVRVVKLATSPDPSALKIAAANGRSRNSAGSPASAGTSSDPNSQLGIRRPRRSVAASGENVPSRINMAAISDDLVPPSTAATRRGNGSPVVTRKPVAAVLPPTLPMTAQIRYESQRGAGGGEGDWACRNSLISPPRPSRDEGSPNSRKTGRPDIPPALHDRRCGSSRCRPTGR